MSVGAGTRWESWTAQVRKKEGRQGVPGSRNSVGEATATRELTGHLGNSSGWSTGCWGEGGGQSV